jgi:membrane protein DedA with SNARE-associated domain
MLSLIGTVIYAAALSAIGYAVGSAWHSAEHDVSVAGYFVAALVVVAIAAFVVFRLRAVRKEAAAAPVPAGGQSGKTGAGRG